MPLTHVRMDLVLKGSTCEDEEYREPFACCSWGCKLEQPLWKAAWMFLKKLNIKYHVIEQFYLWEYIWMKWSHYLQEISISCLLQCDLKYSQYNWGGLNVHKWIKKSVCTHTKKNHYQIIFIHEKKGILLFGTTWMNPEFIRLSKKVKTGKAKCYGASFIYWILKCWNQTQNKTKAK